MDYDTFFSRYPSDALLKKHGVSLKAFEKAFVRAFRFGGPMAVGLSDVGISNLIESGAVKEGWFGQPKIIPHKLDLTERFKKEVRARYRAPFVHVIRIVFAMQDKKIPYGLVTLSPEGDIAYNDTIMKVTEWCDSCEVTSPSVAEMIADIRNILREEPLEYGRIGIFRVTEEGVVCKPNPESSVERLPPRGRPRHPIMPRSEDSEAPWQKAKHIE